MISAPADGGLNWLLLAAAIAALVAAGVAVLVLDRLQPESGPALTLPAWRPRRPRLSSLVGALAAVPLLTRPAIRRSRPDDGEGAAELAPAPEAESLDAELVDPDAAFNLGGVLAESGDFEGAQALYRRADELGHVAGAFNLGVLLHDRGDLDGAEAAYRRADERGDAGGAYSLGSVLAEKGDLAGAERAFDRADTRGHAAGAFNLGVLLEERGDLAGAEAAYRRALERGDGEVAEMARGALVEIGLRR